LISWWVGALRSGQSRFMLLDVEGEEILAETSGSPLTLVTLSELAELDPARTEVLSKAEMESVAGELLAAWQASPRFYVGGRLNANGRCFLDLATSRREYAEAMLAIFARGGRVWTQEEMLSNPDDQPCLREALARWEALDDSATEAGRKDWMQRLPAMLAEARARTRWNMVRSDVPADEDWHARVTKARMRMRSGAP
jgi:hypothetical protein